MLAQTALVLCALLTKSFASASAFSLQGRSRTETALAALAEMTVDDGVSMKWTGSIYPGEELVDLYGDAKDIYEAIRVVNPDFGPEVVPVKRSIDAGLGTSPSVFKRQSGIGCAVMATGSSTDAIDVVRYLQALSGNCGAPNNECRRMTCENTTGSYICSEFSDGTSVPCRLLGDRIWDIRNQCCPRRGSISGHYYAPDRDYSVWVGYANCGHSPNTRPSAYPYPGGSPNGEC